MRLRTRPEPGLALEQRLKPKYESIWLVGGAELTRYFLRGNLADDLIVAILPILFADGVPFVEHVQRAPQLKDVTAFDDGIGELSYEAKQ